jgi:H+/Cl- antiporter ClcA
MTQTPNDLELARQPDGGTVGDALWRSAIDALVKTFLIVVMGNVALGILGGIFSAMTPSSPPFLARTSGGHSDSNSSLMHSWWSAAHEHQFALVYVILFALGARSRLAAVFPGATREPSTTETRFQKISVHFSEN